MSDTKELVLKYAEQIATALRGKFPDHTIYTRYIESPDLNYVELSAKNKKNNEEFTVAYSEPYFVEMKDPNTKQQRAQRIFKDLKIHMGIHE